MPRDGAIIVRDLVGKLEVLTVQCGKCGGAERYPAWLAKVRCGQSDRGVISRQIAQGKLRDARNLLLPFPATHREAGHAQLVSNLLLSSAKFKPELCKLIPRHVAKTNTMCCTMSRREFRGVTDTGSAQGH